MILAQYAIRSKQEYIFRSNRLLDIVGGTEMIRDAFDWVYAAAEQEGIVCQTADVPFTLQAVRDAFAAFEQRMQIEDKDGVCYQRVSLDDVLPGEEQLRRIEAIADPYAMQPQSIMEEQESRRELYDGLKRLTQREQTYLLYRYGFTDGKEHPLIDTAIYFHLTKGRAKKTEEQAMDNLWLELPWWFI